MKPTYKSALLLSVLPLWAISVSLAAPAKTTAPKVAALPKGPNGVAAEVNNERIATADVDRRVNRYKESEKALMQDTPEARQALKNIRDTVLDSLIEWRLLVQEAKKQQITPDPVKLDAAVAEFKKNFASDAEMRAQLAKEGKKPEDIRVLLGEGMVVEEVQNRWMADATVSETEIAKFYRENIKEFAIPDGVRARHILLAFRPGITPAEKAKLKTQAEELLKKARAKDADFGQLAQQNSNDLGSKDVGGALDAFPRGMMVKPFEDAAFAAKKGDIVGPVESEFGYHIIKVEDKMAARTASLEEVREVIRPGLLEGKKQEALGTKMRALVASAKIKKYA